MRRLQDPGLFKNPCGFTLLEVLVSLILGALVVGGLMGLISVSLNFSQRIAQKALVQPVLEAAAGEILANPQKALTGEFAITGIVNAPPIEVQAVEVTLPEATALANRVGKLVRVVLLCRGQVLEFSVLVPTSEF